MKGAMRIPAETFQVVPARNFLPGTNHQSLITNFPITNFPDYQILKEKIYVIS
jgi:hypothetical protein